MLQSSVRRWWRPLGWSWESGQIRAALGPYIKLRQRQPPENDLYLLDMWRRQADSATSALTDGGGDFTAHVVVDLTRGFKIT
jgi:hypothetical protein